jgi:RNA polymerase sigma-70 factor, ECF subfamily
MQVSIECLETPILQQAGTCARSTTVEKGSDLEQVFARYVDPIHRFMYSRVGNREDAEDLTSEVFMKAARLLEAGRPEAGIATWLFTVARTVLADHWRKYYRSGGTVELDERQLDSELTQTANSGPSEANERLLDTVMSGLPDRYRRVLELRFLQGYTIQETATALGISPANAKVIQYRALARAASLAETQVDSTPVESRVSRSGVRSRLARCHQLSRHFSGDAR